MKNNIVLTPELAPIFTKKEDGLREILGIITAVADGLGYESESGFGHAGFAGQYFFVMAGAAVEIPWYAYKVLGKLTKTVLLQTFRSQGYCRRLSRYFRR